MDHPGYRGNNRDGKIGSFGVESVDCGIEFGQIVIGDPAFDAKFDIKLKDLALQLFGPGQDGNEGGDRLPGTYRVSAGELHVNDAAIAGCGDIGAISSFDPTFDGERANFRRPRQLQRLSGRIESVHGGAVGAGGAGANGASWFEVPGTSGPAQNNGRHQKNQTGDPQLFR